MLQAVNNVVNANNVKKRFMSNFPELFNKKAGLNRLASS